MAQTMMPGKKDWAVVRRLVGYDRLELPALPALEHIHDLARDYVNFLHPVRELVSETRNGARIRRQYDAALTPFHRLLDSGVLSTQMTRELKNRSANVDPVRLNVQLEAAQRTLTGPRRSVGFVCEAVMTLQSDPYVRHHVLSQRVSTGNRRYCFARRPRGVMRPRDAIDAAWAFARGDERGHLCRSSRRRPAVLASRVRGPCWLFPGEQLQAQVPLGEHDQHGASRARCERRQRLHEQEP